LAGGHQKISDLLAMHEIEDIDLEIPVMPDLARAADF